MGCACSSGPQVLGSPEWHGTPMESPASPSMKRMVDLSQQRLKKMKLEASVDGLEVAKNDLLCSSPRTRKMGPEPKPTDRNVFEEFKKSVTQYMDVMDHPILSNITLRRIFEMLDVQAHGTLQTKDIQTFWTEMGWADSEESVGRMFKTKEGQKTIGWEAFEKFFSKIRSLDDLRIEGGASWQHPEEREQVFKEKCIKAYKTEWLRGHPRRIKVLLQDTRESVPRPDTFYSCCKFDTMIVSTDFQSGGMVRRLSKHTDVVLSAALSTDGQYLVTSSKDSLVVLWNCALGTLVQQTALTTITCVRFGKKDSVVWVGDIFGSLCELKVSCLTLTRSTQQLGEGAVLNMNHCCKTQLAVSFTHSADILLFDTGEFHVMRKLTEAPMKKPPTVLSTTPANPYLLLALYPSAIRTWDLVSITYVDTHPPTEKWTTGIVLSPPFSGYIAAATTTLELHIINIKNNFTTDLVVPLNSHVYCLSSAPAPRKPLSPPNTSVRLLSGDENGNILCITLT